MLKIRFTNNYYRYKPINSYLRSFNLLLRQQKLKVADNAPDSNQPTPRCDYGLASRMNGARSTRRQQLF